MAGGVPSFFTGGAAAASFGDRTCGDVDRTCGDVAAVAHGSAATQRPNEHAYKRIGVRLRPSLIEPARTRLAGNRCASFPV